MSSSGVSMEGALVHGQNWVYLSFWRFLPSSIVCFGRKGLIQVKNIGFYSIPARPSDQFFGKSPCLGEMLLFKVSSCLQAQTMELTGPPYMCQIPCFARDFRKGPKRQLRGKTSCLGGMLLFTAHLCLQAWSMQPPGPPYVRQIPCCARELRKGPKRQLRGKTPCSEAKWAQLRPQNAIVRTKNAKKFGKNAQTTNWPSFAPPQGALPKREAVPTVLGGSTILKRIWGGNLLYFAQFGDLQPYEPWNFRICSESVSGVPRRPCGTKSTMGSKSDLVTTAIVIHYRHRDSPLR